MSYFVTSHGFDEHGRPAPAAIDVAPPGKRLSLDDARAHACTLLGRKVPNVAIQDGNGKSISGDDLAACCTGEKELTADLRAVAK